MKFQDAQKFFPNKTRNELKKIIDCARRGKKINYNKPEGSEMKVNYAPTIRRNGKNFISQIEYGYIKISSKKDADNYNKLVTLLEQERCS